MGKKGGKGSRARSKLRRKAARRSMKAAMQRQYEAWRDAGINSKSKRARNHKKQERRVRTTARVANPQNPGDYKVYRELNMPFLARTLLLEQRGFKNQYTSKCPRRLVRQYIKDRKLWLSSENELMGI